VEWEAGNRSGEKKTSQFREHTLDPFGTGLTPWSIPWSLEVKVKDLCQAFVCERLIDIPFIALNSL
jgi:hypothetical protein